MRQGFLYFHYATDDFSDSEDDWNADEWSADDEYESDGESTVIDDPDAMGDAVSDDDSDGVSVPMDEDLVPVQGDTEDAE